MEKRIIGHRGAENTERDFYRRNEREQRRKGQKRRKKAKKNFRFEMSDFKKKGDGEDKWDGCKCQGWSFLQARKMN